MDLSRREFMAGAAACACALSAGCAHVNPARMVVAGEDGTLPLPEELKEPMKGVKVLVKGVSEPVLVWKTADGFGAVSIVCTHKLSEVEINRAEGTLDCPSHGSRYKPDGSVLQGPAKRPLRRFKATLEGERLRVAPA
jgi:Rieske Fe-S protein